MKKEKVIGIGVLLGIIILAVIVVVVAGKYSLQGTTQGRYLTGGVPPIRFSM